MNSIYQPGHHPDADTLSAFADQALPPHEQQHLLAHLATCPDCRHLVYLAQQANPIEPEAPQPQPATTSRPWFLSWNLAWPAAAFATLLILTIHFHHSTTPTNPPAQNLTASIAPNQPPPPAPLLPSAQPLQPLRSSLLQAPKPAAAQKTLQPAPHNKLDKQDVIAAPISPPPPPPPAPIAGFGAGLALARNVSTGAALHGTITDPTGAAISRAKITATNTLTGASLSRETSATGDFFLSPLPSGTYTVEATAPGFQSLTQKDVHVVEAPTQLALNLKLPIGSASQTVTVTDAPPALDTATAATLGGAIENQTYTNLPLKARTANPAVLQPPPPTAPSHTASAQQGIYGGTGQTNLNQNYIEGIPVSNVTNATVATNPSKPAAPAVARTAAVAAVPTLAVKKQPTLPSHLPALSTITNAHHSLAIDTAGALFRSEDAGVTWLPVTTQWKGRAIHLALAPPLTVSALAQTKAAADVRSTPPPTFELTTDTGALYTSPDGQTWRLK